ncbi:MAG: hypothetical protein ACLFRF_05925 [Desulfobacterales bacterium]
MSQDSRYTCTDYRLEMVLLSLRRQLAHEDLSEAEKTEIQQEIKRLEAQMGMA